MILIIEDETIALVESAAIDAPTDQARFIKHAALTVAGPVQRAINNAKADTAKQVREMVSDMMDPCSKRPVGYDSQEEMTGGNVALNALLRRLADAKVGEP